MNPPGDHHSEELVTTKIETATPEPKPEPTGGISDLAEAVRSAIVESRHTPHRPAKHRPGEWPRKPIPDIVQPGYAVMVDKNGNGARMVEMQMFCGATGSAEVLPIEGRQRGTISPGGLYDKLKFGQIILKQWAPYPKMRDDGRPHVVRGNLIYPAVDPAVYETVDGVHFHRMFARDELAKAKARAQKG